jgi:predicted Zn-dependent peptidase
MIVSAGGRLTLALFAASLWAQGDFREVESRISDFTLKNGLKFIVMERHQAPVAAFYTYADVGSYNEDAGVTGMAHMFEHMAFKGTRSIGTKNWALEQKALAKVDQSFAALKAEKAKGPKADAARIKALQADFETAQKLAQEYVEPNEFGKIIEESGGRQLNASTAWDRTDYFFSLPSNQAELWFYLESSRFKDPIFREFYKERDVIAEERRLRTENNPIGKLVEEYLATAYKAHPYGIPAIGHMEDIQNYSREQAEAFFKKYYIPSNLTCVVVGDVDPKQIRVLAEKYFGGIPSGPKPVDYRSVEPKQEAERRVILKAQAQRLILMGYHAAGINDPDYPVYGTIQSLLSEGRSSRMYRTLVRDKKLAVQAAGFSGFPGIKFPGQFVFFALNAPGKTNEEVEKAMLQEIEKLKTDKVTEEELAGVRTRYRIGLLSQFNQNTQMAAQLAQWDALTGDWRNLFRFTEKINRVTAEDIQRIAKKTFVESNRTVGYLEPLQPAGR